MVEGDLRALVAIDRRITGHDHSTYFERKLEEALRESDVRISLVAELDGRPVGFIMAPVDLEEFGRTDSAAIMDTIGVDPDYGNRGVGRALVTQLLVNLMTLPVDKVLTEVDWSAREIGFPRSLRLPPVVVSVLRSHHDTARRFDQTGALSHRVRVIRATVGTSPAVRPCLLPNPDLARCNWLDRPACIAARPRHRRIPCTSSGR
jgi:GNAT superfamily N-acetyltransferase